MGHYGIKTPPQHADWSDFLEAWKAADEIELFDSAWNWDHFYPLSPPFEGSNFEGWTMLAAMAQATSRIRIGCMVNGMHYRHPAVTANMITTVDHISGGRFCFGIGAGWNEMESDATASSWVRSTGAPIGWPISGIARSPTVPPTGRS